MFGSVIKLFLQRGETTSMSVSMATQDNTEAGAPAEELDKRTNGGPNGLSIETKNLLWRMSTRRFDTSRPEWIYGQVAINSENPYRVSTVSNRLSSDIYNLILRSSSRARPRMEALL